jgi:hypothetical protein
VGIQVVVHPCGEAGEQRAEFGGKLAPAARHGLAVLQRARDDVGLQGDGTPQLRQTPGAGQQVVNHLRQAILALAPGKGVSHVAGTAPGNVGHAVGIPHHLGPVAGRRSFGGNSGRDEKEQHGQQ